MGTTQIRVANHNVDLHPYVRETEPAVRHLFDGLSAYYSGRLRSVLDFSDEHGVIRMTKEENETYLRAYEAHFNLEFARAVLAGSILQIAYTGIKKYRLPENLPPRCLELNVRASTAGAAFCIGRTVNNIPLGLLIYAGRIQYNHWEKGEPSNSIAHQVFEALRSAYRNDPHFDLGYALDYPTPRPVGHYIVRFELDWISYDEYINDMTSILPPQARAAQL